MSQITVSNLTFAYEGSYDNIFEGVSFRIDTDWKLGFTGRNGRGKTTFLNLLLGNLEYQGRISSSVDFDYFPFPITDKTQPAIELARTLGTAERNLCFRSGGRSPVPPLWDSFQRGTDESAVSHPVLETEPFSAYRRTHQSFGFGSAKSSKRLFKIKKRIYFGIP